MIRKRETVEFFFAGALLLGTIGTAMLGDFGLTLGLALSCIALTVASALRSHGPLHPLSLVLAISAAYVIAGPLEFALLPRDYALSAVPMTLLLAYGSCFVFVARFVGAAFSSRVPPGRMVVALDRYDAGAVWLATVSCFAVALATAITYGFAIGSITRAEIYANEQALLSVARMVTAALVVIACGVASSPPVQQKHPARLILTFFAVGVVAFSLTELFILGDRRLLLSVVLGMACASGVRRLPLWSILAAVIALLLLIGYGFVRNRPVDEWSMLLYSVDALDVLRPTNTEFGGFLIVAEFMLPATLVPESFPGYASALQQVVPRAILPDRPEAPAEWFVRSHFPELAALGYGYGFNAIVESVVNLGDVGPAVVGTLVGAALAYAGRTRATAGLAVFLTAFLMRLDFASLLRSGLLAAFAVTAVLLLRFLRSMASLLSSARADVAADRGNAALRATVVDSDALVGTQSRRRQRH